MRKYLHHLFIRLTKMLEEPNQEQFEDGFDGIPSSEETAVMTPRALARLLSNTTPNSPGYTILSHELNLKIAKEQSKATLAAAWIGAIVALIAVVLTFALARIFHA